MDASSSRLGINSSPTTIISGNVSSLGDYNDPLYLHLFDSSNTILISCVLIGCDNYSIWIRAMSFSLDCKNKLGFIKGTVPKSGDSDLANKWNRCNSLVSWILC